MKKLSAKGTKSTKVNAEEGWSDLYQDYLRSIPDAPALIGVLAATYVWLWGRTILPLKMLWYSMKAAWRKR